MIVSVDRAEMLARLRAKRELDRRRAARPLNYVPWLVFQTEAFAAAETSKRLVVRAGNQALGKTYAGAAITIWRCLGLPPLPHAGCPRRTRRTRALLVASTATQSVDIQKKIRELLPPDEVDWTKTHFDDRVGFGANRPMIFFKNGSTIRVATNDQGPRALQGGTYDFVWIDEVPSPEVLREAERRLLTTGGPLLLTLTPINKDASHIEDLITAGIYAEVHGRLTVENLMVAATGEQRVMEDGTPYDEAWIAHQRKITPAEIAPVTLDGEWRTLAIGKYFSKVFNRGTHVRADAFLDPVDGPIRWHLGMDYASADRDDGLVAVLAQVQQVTIDPIAPKEDHIIVVDAVVLPGVATMQVFAGEVVDMLRRSGLSWRNLHSAYGDNPVKAQTEYKSNYDFIARLALRLQVDKNSIRPHLLGAKDGVMAAGMPDAGVRYLHELMAQQRLIFHPAAEKIIQAIEEYTHNDKFHPTKDRVDALRYALKDYIKSPTNPHSGVVRVRVGR